MTKPVIRVALASLVLLGMAVPGQAATNPLLGRWQAEPGGVLAADGTDSCFAIPELDFSSASQTMHTAASKFSPAGKVTKGVKYFVAGPKVYVSSNAGFAGAPMYTMIGPGELRDPTDCKYKRM